MRPATIADAATIRQIISLVQINPMSLNWQRFILAIDRDGKVIGCGQVKPHSDGSLELASIAVLPDWRGKGIARVIINHLLEKYPGRLYLTCRSQLGPLYQKFDFQALTIRRYAPLFQALESIGRPVQ